jgi:spore germination cell wall hydrolase CwlJ-like protein
MNQEEMKEIFETPKRMTPTIRAIMNEKKTRPIRTITLQKRQLERMKKRKLLKEKSLNGQKSKRKNNLSQ